MRAYGTRIARVLGEARSAHELGEDFGGGLTAAEIRYMMEFEWAREPEDVLWRRSKLGLHLDDAQRRAVARFMAEEPLGVT